ncbi:MAG: autotransporter domain-containing protein [Xanthobacteraceae bacterium]
MPFPASVFQPYVAADAASIEAGPFALYSVPVDVIQPGQLNVGFSEIERKMYGWDTLTPSQIQSTLLTDVEPVVIGPGGILILENGHHTFTSLEDSAYGATDPTVYVNVIANFSNMTTAQFWATMLADDLLLPLNDGVPEVVSATGSPVPTSLQGLTNDPYRGLEESILKNQGSKLFKTSSNITGAAGPLNSAAKSEPGLDKLTGDFSDFLWADAYRNANGGLGLPYLSLGDIALATQWNLNPNSTTTLPNIGTVTVGQMPGFILNQNLIEGTNFASTISNATLSTGTLAANGTFTGITQFNIGTPSEPILVGTPQSGFVMQMGYDSGFSVTLNGPNTYTGGTTIIAGDLIIANDASLGAAPPESISGFNSSLTISNGFPTNVLAAVQADNGIIFNSELEGMATLQLGTTSGGGTQTFTTNRPIAVDGETATINLNGYIATLNGPILSLGTFGDGLGNESSISALTIEDTSSGSKGVLVLPASANNSDYYGNWIITSGTLNVSSDASLGNATLPVDVLGQIELNGGTLQAGASFSSARSLFMGGGSTIDTNGYTISFAGNMQDVQRTLVVENSNTSGNGAGSVSFGTFEVGATATLNVNAGSGTGGGAGTSVTFTDGIIRDPGGTLILQPTTTGNIGTLVQGATNSEDVFNGLSSQNTPVNGIVSPWIVIYGATPGNGTLAAQTPASPYSFATYGANGYTAATVGGAITNNILTSISTNTVVQSTSITGATVTGSLQAYALSVQNGTGIALNGHTLTLGDGTDPAGLILDGGASISNGTLAFGGSEGVIWLAGQGSAGATPNVNTISAAIIGAGGLTFAGGLDATDLSQVTAKDGLSLVNITTASTETGPIIIDSGAVGLNAVNVFSSSLAGITLEDTKSSPSPATLNVNANNTVAALNSAGSNSTVNIASGDTLTIGETTGGGANLNSTLSSTVAGSGSGSLVKAGTGLLDLSGSGGVSFGSTGSVTVDAGALRIGNGVFSTSATTPITVDSGAELQYSGNSGSVFHDPIEGNGVFHLVGGTVQLTSTSNSYTGGTVIEVGSTLDVTTANLPTGGAISNAGGILLFDQDTTGTFSGVMSDGAQAGGASDPNDMACITAGVTCGSTTTLSGTLIRDDSATGGATMSNVTLSNVQAYSGMTYIEAGTLTLGATDTIKTSSGVVLGRVGGAFCNGVSCSGTLTAILALGANNTISGLADDPSNTTQVQLDGHTLTLAPITGTSWSYAGSIIDNGASGNLVQNGLGTSILTGTSTYTGTTMVDAGTLEVDGSIATSGLTINNGGTLVGHGNVDPPMGMTVNPGGVFAPGTPGVPGTFMTVTGNLTFTPGTPASTYLVQLNSTTSTYANVTGTASLSGNVLAAFTPGSYQAKQYTILESAGLGGTTFGALGTTNLPNFNASLSYSANDVFLNLNATLGPSGGGNGNEQNVANALNNFFNSGGTLTPNFATIFGLSGGNLNTALAQLSGEANTGGENASFEMMSDFLGAMVDPTAGGRGGAPGSAGNAFAAEQSEALPADIASAYASVIKPPPLAPFEQRWSAWGEAFGGYNKTDGNTAAGTNTVTATAFGFAGGEDYHFSPDTFAGFAVAGAGSNWGLAQNLGTGRSNSLQVGLYGTHYFGRAYISGSVGVANNWMTTNRTAPLGDQLTANFNAQSYGARLEGGYRYGIAAFGVTPYAALQTQFFHTPSYSETDLTGGGFGLSYAASNATDTRSELGARFDSVQVFNQMPLVWRARLAWAHDWVSSPTLTATFETLPGANFVVNGAGMPANSALTTLGAELYVTPHWSVEAKFDGDFANTAETYAGSGTLRYRW